MLVVMTTLALSCVMIACSEHKHTYSTEWTYDAYTHWNSATCGDDCKDVKGNAEGHRDANHDGKCDICLYVDAGHTHTYSSEWKYDASKHWNEGTCFHDVRQNEADHTLNEANICTECGYHSSKPDVSTIANALKVAKAQKGEVKYGYSLNAGGELVYFEYINDGGLYVKDYNENWYSASGDEGYGIRISGGEFSQIENLSADCVDGYGFEMANIYGAIDETKYYGVNNLLDALYTMKKDNLNNDASENVANDEYTFSFGYFANEALWMIKVEFKLDPTNYYVSNMYVESTKYSETNYNGELNYEESNGVYTLTGNAISDETNCYRVEQNPNKDKNPYDKQSTTVSEFELYVSETKVENELSIEDGSTTYVAFGDIMPTTGLISTAVVECIVTDSAGEEAFGLGLMCGQWDPQENGNYFYALKMDAYIEGEYNVKVTVNSVEKEFVVNVTPAQPSNLMAYAYSSEYKDWQEIGPDGLVAYETLKFQVDIQDVNLKADDSVNWTVVDENNNVVETFTFTPVEIDSYGNTLTVYDIIATADTALGRYTLTATSTVDETIMVSFEVEIKSFNIDNITSNSWLAKGLKDWQDAEVEFYDGNVVHIISNGVTDKFTYNYANGVFTLTVASDDEDAQNTLGYEILINTNAELCITYFDAWEGDIVKVMESKILAIAKAALEKNWINGDNNMQFTTEYGFISMFGTYNGESIGADSAGEALPGWNIVQASNGDLEITLRNPYYFGGGEFPFEKMVFARDYSKITVTLADGSGTIVFTPEI